MVNRSYWHQKPQFKMPSTHSVLSFNADFFFLVFYICEWEGCICNSAAGWNVNFSFVLIRIAKYSCQSLWSQLFWWKLWKRNMSVLIRSKEQRGTGLSVAAECYDPLIQSHVLIWSHTACWSCITFALMFKCKEWLNIKGISPLAPLCLESDFTRSFSALFLSFIPAVFIKRKECGQSGVHIPLTNRRQFNPAYVTHFHLTCWKRPCCCTRTLHM